MRVLQIVPYFYPAWAYGGPAKLVYDTSFFFASQGHQVTVYTSDSYDAHRRMPKKKRIETQNVVIRYFRNIHNTLAYKFNIFFTPGLYVLAIREIPTFDVVHIHDFYTPQNFWVALLAKMYNVPYVMSVHGCLEDKRLVQRSIFKKIYLLMFGNWMLQNAAMAIATSTNEYQAYQQFGVNKKRIFLLGHGVDKQEFITSLSKQASRKKLGLKQNKMVITFLGRIHRIKGLDLFTKAIALMKDSSVQFVIAGSDDGFLPELKRLIKQYKLENSVKLLGTCFGEAKARLFKATDIFVYPSYSEGFSLGILEALAAGLPLVITTGCHFELVKKEGAGLIVEPNEKAIAAALESLVNSGTKRATMARKAVKLIDKHYSMKKIGNDLLSLYKKVSFTI